MLEEVLIFRGSDRVAKHWRNLFVGEQDAALQGKTANRGAIVRINLSDHVWLIILERANLGQIARIDEEKPGANSEQNGADQ